MYDHAILGTDFVFGRIGAVVQTYRIERQGGEWRAETLTANGPKATELAEYHGAEMR
jgi:hypothetical protein